MYKKDAPRVHERYAEGILLFFRVRTASSIYVRSFSLSGCAYRANIRASAALDAAILIDDKFAIVAFGNCGNRAAICAGAAADASIFVDSISHWYDLLCDTGFTR